MPDRKRSDAGLDKNTAKHNTQHRFRRIADHGYAHAENDDTDEYEYDTYVQAFSFHVRNMGFIRHGLLIIPDNFMINLCDLPPFDILGSRLKAHARREHSVAEGRDLSAICRLVPHAEAA